MKIAIDISPLKSGHFLQHRVRGTGFYLEHLKSSLTKYFPNNDYVFFTRGESLPSDIDLVHYPYFEPFFRTLPFFKKHKTVVTVHDLTPLVFPKHFPRGVKGELKWRLQKHALKSADAIITDSKSSKRDIVKYAGIVPDKVKVVYLAAGEQFKKLDDKTQKAKIKDLKTKYNLPDRFILYVGDVTWNKNLPNLINAAINTNIPLVLVGKALTSENFDRKNPWNQDLAKAQELIKDQISKTKKQVPKIQNPRPNTQYPIRPLGFVPDEDLVSLYNAATVFVMPSLYEGFGLPVLEAMSCGCPVITTKCGSLEEIAGDSAFFVDTTEKSITEGIEKVFKDWKLQETLSQKGLKNAEKFSWKQTADETTGVYESII